MVPTKERNVQGLALVYKGEVLLFDCGEGTQRQMNIAGLNRTKVRKILISHWHGDHVAGLIGLLQTIGNSDNPQPVSLWGPPGTKKHMDHLVRSVIWDVKVDLAVHEIRPRCVSVFFENEDYALSSARLDHSAPCLGFRFEEKAKRRMLPEKLKKAGVRGRLIGELQRGKSVKIGGKDVHPDDVSLVKKGRSFALVADTRLCQSAVDLAGGADVLVCESSFDSSMQDKADERKHLTVRDACQIAQMSGVKRLVLTHFSQRYKSLKALEEEAKTLFPNVAMAHDFMVVRF